MNNAPDIIIPHHNRWDLIGTCLSKIPMGYKVFVVRGFTFANACNKGASLSEAEYIMFLNDDVVLTKEAFDEILTHNEDIIGLPLRIPKLGKTVYGMNMYWGKYGNQNSLVDSVKTQLGFESCDTCQIPATGAAVVIKRKVFNELGGFFPEYKNGGEDNELFLKALEKGCSFGYINTVCDHLHSSSEGRYANDDANHALLTKHFPEKRLLKILGKNISTNCLISVIIPTRKKEGTPFSLKFLKDQTHKNIEIIIIRDEKGKGASWARNQGRKKAKGKYLFFCDDDIQLKPIMLEALLTKLHYSNASFSYCNYDRVGKLTGKVAGIPWDVNVLRSKNYISTMSLIKAKDFPKEGFDENLERFQDWDLWLRMAEDNKYGIHFDETLFTAYYEEGDISSNKENIQSSIEAIKIKHNLFINNNSMAKKRKEEVGQEPINKEEIKTEEIKKNLKIEIGSKSPVFVQGDWSHIDTQSFPHTEYTTDSFSAMPFDDNSVEKIFSKRIMQKLSKKEIMPALIDWFRILEPMGSIKLITVDVTKAMGKYLQTFEEKYLELIYGAQSDRTEFYYNGFTPALLKKMLIEAGFVNVHESYPQVDYFNTQIEFVLEAEKPKK